MVVGSVAAEHLQYVVGCAQLREPFAKLRLGHSFGQVVFAPEHHLLRHVVVQLVDTAYAYALQHPGLVRVCVRDISVAHRFLII